MTETYDGWGLTDSDYNPPTIPTPNALTKILETAVAPFGCVVSYDNTGGNCGAVGVYRSDASGMGEPVGAYLLVSGSEGPWPYSSANEPLDVQWSDDDVDPDWDAFGVYLYSDTVEAGTFPAVRGVDALVTMVVGWARANRGTDRVAVELSTAEVAALREVLSDPETLAPLLWITDWDTETRREYEHAERAGRLAALAAVATKLDEVKR
jgi:hypothetical protein